MHYPDEITRIWDTLIEDYPTVLDFLRNFERQDPATSHLHNEVHLVGSMLQGPATEDAKKAYQIVNSAHFANRELGRIWQHAARTQPDIWPTLARQLWDTSGPTTKPPLDAMLVIVFAQCGHWCSTAGLEMDARKLRNMWADSVIANRIHFLSRDIHKGEKTGREALAELIALQEAETVYAPA